MNSLTHTARRQPLVTAVVTAVLAAAIGLLAALPAHAASTPSSDEQSVITSINQYRAEYGLPALAVSPGLQSDSHDWAAFSAAQGVSNHDTRANVDASCARASNNTSTSCTEIVARVSGSTPVNAVQAFKGSNSHAQTMRCACTHIGAGAVRGSDSRWYVVVRVMNATSGGTVPTTTTTTTTQPTTTTTTAPSGTFTSSQKFVKSVYADFLGRQPNSSELAHWSGQVATQSQREAFIRTYAYSNEYIGVLIDRYYQVALGRPADSGGKAYWADIIRRKVLTPAQVAAHFYASDEYFKRSGSSLHNWVSDLYVQLLGRQADAAGRNHWVSVAQSQGRQVVARAFYDSRESLNVRVDTVYRALLNRASDPGGRTYWGDIIARSGNDVDLGVFLAASSEYLTRSQSRY